MHSLSAFHFLQVVGHAFMSFLYSYAAILRDQLDVCFFLWDLVLVCRTRHASSDPTSSIPFLYSYMYVNCHY